MSEIMTQNRKKGTEKNDKSQFLSRKFKYFFSIIVAGHKLRFLAQKRTGTYGTHGDFLVAVVYA